MKKIRRIIIIISVFLVLISVGLVGYHFYEQSQKEPEVPTVASVIAEDESLLKNSNEKFPEKEKSVFIKEGTDGSFAEGDKNFEKTLTYITNSFFDIVNIESKYFTADKEGTAEEMAALSYAVSRIQQAGKKAVVVIDASASADDTLKILRVADGVMIKSNTLTEETVDNIKQIRAKAEGKIFVLDIPTDSESLKKVDKGLTESLCVRASGEEDAKTIISLEKELTEKGITLNVILDFSVVDRGKVSVGTPLKNLYELRKSKSINQIGFSYLKNIRKNLHNSFSAVKTYMTKGICPEIAFREVGADCYAGDVKTAELFTAEFTVYGSNLFPVIIDGKDYGVPATGSMTVRHDLSAEENILNISQNESRAEYKVNCVFGEEIVRYIMPDSVISAQPKEKVALMIVAHCKAEITVRLGTERFEAVCDKNADGYTAFVCQITMPSSEEEVASLGKVTVLVSFAGKTIQLEGPSVSAEKEQTTAVTDPLTTTQTAPSTRYEIGNYLQELQSDAFEISQKITTTRTPHTQGTTQTYTPFTGNQMCVVTAAYADTKPIAAEDNLVPYYTVLPYGTMDYVVGESEGYNVDDDETEYYYNLQSGRKIKREAVQLIPKTDMGDNSLQVISVSSGGGEVRIVLSTRWKVPYDLHYTPQNYYYNYSKHYNVTSFTASTIEFTFHYTSSAAGEIDTSGSDVISSAYWSVNESAKTAKLIMPLKTQGKYYGTSIEYDSSGNMVITVNRKPTGATGAVVVLDAGHGGKDPGAVGINNQVRECDVNILVAYAAMQELQARGVTVYLTRYGDDYMLLEERKALTRSIKPDLFVSVHSNGSLKKTNIGTSTYYFKPFSYSLASNIYNELLSVHRNHFYQGQQEVYGELADGVQYYPFGVTRIEDCPSTLIEIGYLTNDAECYKLIDTNNQKLLGKAIADGIMKTLSQ